MKSNPSSKIIIASVNRSQADHRLYEKWGLYFLSRGFKDLHLYGNPTEEQVEPVFTIHNSLKYGRLLSPFNFIFLLFKIKPDKIICVTFELLIACGIYKFLSGKKIKIYYDIIENYSLNLRYQNNHSLIVKMFFIPHIKFREWLSQSFITHYFYSDQVYLNQLAFLKTNSTFLPNYYSYPNDLNQIKKDNNTLNFLITGTISKEYGIEKGLEWFLTLKEKYPIARLKVIGHKTNSFHVTKDNSISYYLSNKNIPHKELLKEIDQCDVLLLPYNWNRSFYGCVPSKLYEALTLGTNTIIEYSDHLLGFQDSDGVHMIKNDSDLSTLNLKKAIKKTQRFKFSEFYNILDLNFKE